MTTRAVPSSRRRRRLVRRAMPAPPSPAPPSTPFAARLAEAGQLPTTQTERQRAFASRLGSGFKAAEERLFPGEPIRDILHGAEVATSGFRGAFPIAERTVTVPSATRWPTDPEGREAFQKAFEAGEIPAEGFDFRDAQREAIQPLLRGEASLSDTAKRLLELGRATTGPEAWVADFLNPVFWVSTYAVPLRLARPLAAEMARLAPGVGQAARTAAQQGIPRLPLSVQGRIPRRVYRATGARPSVAGAAEGVPQTVKVEQLKVGDRFSFQERTGVYELAEIGSYKGTYFARYRSAGSNASPFGHLDAYTTVVPDKSVPLERFVPVAKPPMLPAAAEGALGQAQVPVAAQQAPIVDALNKAIITIQAANPSVSNIASFGIPVSTLAQEMGVAVDSPEFIAALTSAIKEGTIRSGGALRAVRGVEQSARLPLGVPGTASEYHQVGLVHPVPRPVAAPLAAKPAPGATLERGAGVQPPPAPTSLAAGQGLPPPAPAAPVAPTPRRPFPMPGRGAPPPVKPPGAAGGVPPTTGGVPAQPPGITKALRQAKAIVDLQRPGAVSARAGRVPVVSQTLDYIKPVRGMFQKGNEFLGESWVGRDRVKRSLITEANSTFVPLMNDLDRVFGKDATKGLSIPAARFTGTAAERAPWSDTLYDIIQRPGLYQLTPEQTALLQRFHQRNIALLEKVNKEFGTEIGRFENPQGFFLPNKDVSEDALEVLETLGRSQRSALVSGQAKTRIFDTAFDRWKADPSFVPETNVRALTSAMDHFKASAAAAETFRAGIGGKTLLEVVEETHPALLKMKQDLTKRVTSLKGRLGTARAGVTTSAASQKAAARKLTATEAKIADVQDRMSTLGEEWGPELGFLWGELSQLAKQAKALDAAALAARTRLTGQAGKALNLADELDDAVELLDQVRRSYKAANLQGYTLVREGNLFRYFKADQAASVRQLLETSNNPVLNFIENIRKTAFVADASPIVGVQAPLHWFAAPLQTSKDWIGGAVRGAQKGDILGAFKSEQLAKDIAANPQSYEDFSFYMGLELGGVPEEFSVGFLSKLPKIGRQIGVVNESMFNAVLRESKNHFDAHVANFLKDGMAPDQAKAMAAQMVRTVNPIWDSAAMGLSEARARLLRTPFTSVSFLLKPAELSANGLSGMMKIGLGQAKKLTPQERVSARVLLTMAASLTGVTVASAGLNALARGKDPLDEIQEVLDPQSGRWWTISVGDRRVPIGGPFRSMFKAVVPSKYRELGDAPYPFDGFGRFAMGKMTPVLSTLLELRANKDYFGDPILKGKFAERLLRFMEYGIEGMAPLTAGAALGAVRTGQGPAVAAEEAASQFLGVSAYRESPFQRRDAEAREWAKGQGITAIQGYSDLLPAVQKRFDAAFPETAERVKTESKRRREQRGDVPWLPVEAGELSEKSWGEFYGTVDETNRQFLQAFPEAERLEVYLGVVGNTVSNLELSKSQRRRYQELAGQQALALLPALLEWAVYKQAADEQKRLWLQQALSDAREQARNMLLPELFQQFKEGAPAATPTPIPTRRRRTVRRAAPTPTPVGAGR